MIRLSFILLTSTILFSSGNAQESKVLIAGSYFDYGSDFLMNPDGSYMITGSTSSKDGDFAVREDSTNQDIFITKINADGSKAWTKIYGGEKSYNGKSIVRTSDGGYVISAVYVTASFKKLDVYIFKIDANGEQVWSDILGGTGDEEPLDMVVGADGSIYLTGYTWSGDVEFDDLEIGRQDIFVYKFNSAGEPIWIRTYGGTDDELPTSIQLTSDDGILLSGSYRSNDGTFDQMHAGGGNMAFIMKLNSDGDVVWTTGYGATLGMTQGQAATELASGHFVLTGTASTTNGEFEGIIQENRSYDIFVAELDEDGNKVSLSAYGSDTGERPYDLIATSDNGFMITGWTYADANGDFPASNGGDFGQDMFLMKFNSELTKQWVKQYGGAMDDWIEQIMEHPEGGYVLHGTTKSDDGDFEGLFQGRSDAFMMRVDAQGAISEFVGTSTEGSLEGVFSFTLSQNYPNPFNPSTQIHFQLHESMDVRLEVFNVVGQSVAVLIDKNKGAGSYVTEFKADHLPSGLYIYRLNGTNHSGAHVSQTRKMMLVK